MVSLSHLRASAYHASCRACRPRSIRCIFFAAPTSIAFAGWANSRNDPDARSSAPAGRNLTPPLLLPVLPYRPGSRGAVQDGGAAGLSFSFPLPKSETPSPAAAPRRGGRRPVATGGGGGAVGGCGRRGRGRTRAAHLASLLELARDVSGTVAKPEEKVVAAPCRRRGAGGGAGAGDGGDRDRRQTWSRRRWWRSRRSSRGGGTARPTRGGGGGGEGGGGSDGGLRQSAPAADGRRRAASPR